MNQFSKIAWGETIKKQDSKGSDGYVVAKYNRTGAPEHPVAVASPAPRPVQMPDYPVYPQEDQASLAMSNAEAGNAIDFKEEEFTKEQLMDTIKRLHAMVIDLNSRPVQDAASKALEQRDRVKYEGSFGTVETRCCTCKAYDEFMVVVTLSDSEMKYTPPSNPEMTISLQYLPEGRQPHKPVSVISYGISFDFPGTPYTAAVFLNAPS